MRMPFYFLLFSFSLASCQSADTAKKASEPAFETQVIDDAVQIGYGLSIGDVDGDGKPDILLADKKQFVWYRNGDWQRFVMADSLTERDNVCLAARDLNGDGQVEVAVGAQWNPGETSDTTASGAVFYLIRPEDPTQRWEAVPLPHEPTTHRMHWVKAGSDYQLVVLPLHGRGNQNGEGEGVKVFAYTLPEDPKQDWTSTLIDQSMHLTHNFDIISQDDREALLIGGKEGAKLFTYAAGNWSVAADFSWPLADNGFGEIRKKGDFVYGIQPMHGNELAVYSPTGERKVLTDSLRQGHALAVADLLGQGQDQIVLGWREANEQEEIGVKIFVPKEQGWNAWQTHWIDRNDMACEDLKIADLNGDGKADIIAAGRSTHNLKIYWNRSE